MALEGAAEVAAAHADLVREAVDGEVGGEVLDDPGAQLAEAVGLGALFVEVDAVLGLGAGAPQVHDEPARDLDAVPVDEAREGEQHRTGAHPTPRGA